MIKFDDVALEETKEHNPNQPQIPDHSQKILIIEYYGSGKANALFNRINQQRDTHKIYLYAEDLNEAKYQFLIKIREDVRTKYINNS